MKSSGFVVSILWLACLFQFGCNKSAKSVSFYYWRTNFRLDSVERQTLTANHVRALYTRYFDIDFPTADSAPGPIAITSFDSSSLSISIIPVVYIRNRVFEKLSLQASGGLSEKVFSLINGISKSIGQTPKLVQFDCDWTESTREKYFLFLKQYKAIATQSTEATIRLHQVKYPIQTGIPPVDYGALMFYNMGDIDAGNNNSIYDKSIAEKYSPYIKSYPLTLDIALPIFAWGLQIREGKVIKLLNKMNFLHFENDSNFMASGKGRYTARQACFHGGYYFQDKDEVKTEHVPEQDLLEIVTQVNRYSNHRIRDIIFYDLDKENINLYEAGIFKKIMDRTD